MSAPTPTIQRPDAGPVPASRSRGRRLIAISLILLTVGGGFAVGRVSSPERRRSYRPASFSASARCDGANVVFHVSWTSGWHRGDWPDTRGFESTPAIGMALPDRFRNPHTLDRAPMLGIQEAFDFTGVGRAAAAWAGRKLEERGIVIPSGLSPLNLSIFPVGVVQSEFHRPHGTVTSSSFKAVDGKAVWDIGWYYVGTLPAPTTPVSAEVAFFDVDGSSMSQTLTIPCV